MKTKGFGAATSATAIGAAAPQEMLEQASPEEQKVYEAFVNAARLQVFHSKSRDAIADMLQGEDPVLGIAQAAAAVSTRAAVEMKRQAQMTVPNEVVVQGMDEILTALIELGQSRDAPQLSEEQQTAAMLQALDQTRYEMQQAGVLDEEGATSDFEAAKALSEDELVGRFSGFGEAV